MQQPNPNFESVPIRVEKDEWYCHEANCLVRYHALEIHHLGRRVQLPVPMNAFFAFATLAPADQGRFAAKAKPIVRGVGMKIKVGRRNCCMGMSVEIEHEGQVLIGILEIEELDQEEYRRNQVSKFPYHDVTATVVVRGHILKIPIYHDRLVRIHEQMVVIP
jgi:hypothetical protein